MDTNLGFIELFYPKSLDMSNALFILIFVNIVNIIGINTPTYLWKLAINFG